MTKQNTNYGYQLNREKPKYSVGLDVGTSKICALVASKDQDSGNVVVLGSGIVESEGLSRGVVTNIEKTVHCIQKAVEQARQQSGVDIKEVTVGIAGDHIDAIRTPSIISISNPTNEITQEDVNRLVEEAKNVSIPSDRQIIHIIPQDFTIDGQFFSHSPVGMSGRRLEAKVLIITALTSTVKNIYHCVERAGLIVKELVLEPLASSRAVLTDEEKEVGVAMIDIGGGTTDIAVFKDNVIRYTSIFGIAGQQITDDIRLALNIVLNQAEELKKNHGHSYMDSISKDSEIMIPGIGGRKPTELYKSVLCSVIQPRMTEILEFAKLEIQRSEISNMLGAGVVITGGAVQLQGSEELAVEVLEMPVKMGMPFNISMSGLITFVNNPVFSTCVGLALWGLDNLEKNIEQETAKISEPKKPIKIEINTEPVLNNLKETEPTKKKDGWWGRVKETLKDL